MVSVSLKLKVCNKKAKDPSASFKVRCVRSQTFKLLAMPTLNRRWHSFRLWSCGAQNVVGRREDSRFQVMILTGQSMPFFYSMLQHRSVENLRPQSCTSAGRQPCCCSPTSAWCQSYYDIKLTMPS